MKLLDISQKLKALTLVGLTSPALIHAASVAEQVSKPNVVLILIDDFGYECLSANGGQSYKTPIMDRLAETGVRMEHCYAQPLSTPTRVQLMTGIGNRTNYSNFGYLDTNQTTFGNLLRNNGYATCIAGKWQLGESDTLPNHFGFDEFYLWHLFKKGPRYKNPALVLNGKVIDYKDGKYGPDIISDCALDFITRTKDKPFFLYYPLMLTHAPYEATPDSMDDVDNDPNIKKDYFADMTAYTDKLIGKLIDKLDELHLRKNTIVLILGDNGTGKSTVSRFMGRDVKGGKGMSNTWGNHVPGIVNWPGHVVKGKVSKDLINTTDFLPTICEVTGTKVPDELKIEGRSFLPQLYGKKGNPRDFLYVWYAPDGGDKPIYEFAHDANYKLYTDGRFYNVKKDDLEKSPLSDDQLDAKAKAAKAKLQEALKQNNIPRSAYFLNQYQRSKEGAQEDDEISGEVKKKNKAK